MGWREVWREVSRADEPSELILCVVPQSGADSLGSLTIMRLQQAFSHILSIIEAIKCKKEVEAGLEEYYIKS